MSMFDDRMVDGNSNKQGDFTNKKWSDDDDTEDYFDEPSVHIWGSDQHLY